MDLGAFSLSLTVRDIAASRAFYEKLGFIRVLGEQDEKWLILRNGQTTIGLFEGAFERNTLTFNPGWSSEAQPLNGFMGVREIQRELKAKGLTLELEADALTSGPGSIMLLDPDGNPILIDQHVG